MASNRRPMMLWPALELFQELPPRLRVDKRALVAMHRRLMPELRRWPRATANSLVDWNRAFSSGGSCASFFRELVSNAAASTNIASRWLDPAAVEKALVRNFGMQRTEMKRRPTPESAVTGLRRAMSRSRLASIGLRLAERSARRVQGRSLGASEARVIVRLALIGLLQRGLDSMLSAPLEAAAPVTPRDAGGRVVGSRPGRREAGARPGPHQHVPVAADAPRRDLHRAAGRGTASARARDRGAARRSCREQPPPLRDDGAGAARGGSTRTSGTCCT